MVGKLASLKQSEILEGTREHLQYCQVSRFVIISERYGVDSEIIIGLISRWDWSTSVEAEHDVTTRPDRVPRNEQSRSEGIESTWLLLKS